MDYLWLTVAILATKTAISRSCEIPGYYRDSWSIPTKYGGGSLILRDKSSVYRTTGNLIIHYECVQRDNRIFVFQLRQRVTLPLGKSGVLCLLISDIPGLGITLQRLNQKTNGSLMLGPQIVETSMLSMENNVCEGGNSRDMIVITRQAPGCVFPTRIHGLWDSTIKGVDKISVAERKVKLMLDNRKDISFRCHRKDKHFYMLRTKDKNTDGIICLRLDTSNIRYVLKTFVLKGGTLWNNTLTLLPKYKPAYLFVDCEWNDVDSIMFRLKRSK